MFLTKQQIMHECRERLGDHRREFSINECIGIAAVIASCSHLGQELWDESAYFLHVAEVAILKTESHHRRVLGFLHDLIEKTQTNEKPEERWTLDDLRVCGMPDRIIRGLDAATRRFDAENEGQREPYFDYLSRVALNEDALVTELESMHFNLSSFKLRTLKRESRYDNRVITGKEYLLFVQDIMQQRREDKTAKRFSKSITPEDISFKKFLLKNPHLYNEDMFREHSSFDTEELSRIIPAQAPPVPEEEPFVNRSPVTKESIKQLAKDFLRGKTELDAKGCLGLAQMISGFAHLPFTLWDKQTAYAQHIGSVAFSKFEDPVLQAIALLHDIVEDTNWTLTDLRDCGFPEEVVAGVEAMTQRPGEPDFDYIRRLSRNANAIKVKLRDIDYNLDGFYLKRHKKMSNIDYDNKLITNKEYLVAVAMGYINPGDSFAEFYLVRPHLYDEELYTRHSTELTTQIGLDPMIGYTAPVSFNFPEPA